jgi:hypothetical protein
MKALTKMKEDERSWTQGKHLNSTFVDLNRTIPYPDFSRSTTGTPSTTNMYFSESQFFINIFFPTIQNSDVQDRKYQHKGTNKGWERLNSQICRIRQRAKYIWSERPHR